MLGIPEVFALLLLGFVAAVLGVISVMLAQLLVGDGNVSLVCISVTFALFYV